MDETLNSEQPTGLTEQEALRRLQADGFNETPSTKRRSVARLALEVALEPMFLLLLGAGATYLLLGDREEALFLLGFVFVVMGITLYQQRKTERALEALRDLSSPRALVIRDGSRKRIPGREVVVGDLLVLSEGDRVPADAVLHDCENLSVDESLLTGESVPVRKIQWDGVSQPGRPGGDDLPFVYSATLVVTGHGLARVLATGASTEIGKIGKALQTVEPEETLLERETARLVRVLAGFGLSLCMVVVVVYGLTRGSWLNGFLAGITTAMALLPEEFPVVLTIFLALGAWRLSRSQVLTRRTPAVETLGAATVLCVDKTGTLTHNRMAVARLFANDQVFDVADTSSIGLPEAVHEVVEFGILASQADPFDPMEKAFHDLGQRNLANTEHLHQNWSLVREYPLSSSLLAMSHVWRSPDGGDYVIAAKGAPEAIVDLCHLDDVRTSALLRRVETMADAGLRVLAVARARFKMPALPGEQHDFRFEFLGLVGLADPIRATVPAAIRECYQAGIRVVMITGDYPGTARAIAQQIGLTPREECITGPEIDGMDDAELQRRVSTTNIFARVVPEQKWRLVSALKADGQIVAMTGDGVNDAPALKAAHIGIAMGGRGTDVARESSALVLLDDDFSSIVRAIRLGRRIFDNLKKAMTYIFAIHVPIAGLSLIPVVLRWPLMLMPVHIVFLELIIDPACSVVFEAEPEEANIMRRRPRDPAKPLFGRSLIVLGLVQGLSVLAIVLAVCGLALLSGRSETQVRTLTFTTLVVANLGLILANRSWSRVIVTSLRSPNPALWWVFGLATAFLGVVLYQPAVRRLFRFSPLQPAELLLCLAGGLASIVWFELVKMVNRPERSSRGGSIR